MTDRDARPIVFLGPTLPVAEAASLLDAEFRPPVRRGDLARVGGARAVLIVDGEFDQSFAVSPKEILSLLDDGVQVFGAASMGAIRAAELGEMGMRGIGRIYDAYSAGRIVGDDEVALAYCPWTFAGLSVPLVEVRLGVERLVADGWISPEESRRIVRRAGRIFYADRSRGRVRAALEAVLGADRATAAGGRGRVDAWDAKGADARLALETVAASSHHHQHEKAMIP